MPQFGDGAAPFLIAGPCVVESDDLNLRVAETLVALGAKTGLHVVYKASFDKANRSRLAGARGPGLDAGLRALRKVREATGLPMLTDVHEAAQVAEHRQRSEEHTSELQSLAYLVCRLLLEKKKTHHATPDSDRPPAIPTQD